VATNNATSISAINVQITVLRFTYMNYCS